MDITEFYDTFFEEAAELLAEMESHLLELDLDAPDAEQLNAIFRAAHSIKGGAGTFGFEALQRTTHLLENLLDYTRRGELALRRDIVDIFLDAKDMLNEQLDAYRADVEPDPDALERICCTLRQLALEEIGEEAVAEIPRPAPAEAVDGDTPGAGGRYRVALLGVAEKDRLLLIGELGQLGEIEGQSGDNDRYEVTLSSSLGGEDIEAVMCFIAEPEQLEISPLQSPESAAGKSTGKKNNPEGRAEQKSPQPRRAAAKSVGESTSIRVPVTKVDQIINLVGELIITQSMLNQVADSGGHGNGGWADGLNLLARNARDLQEAVMSVRMVPMDTVFSRFPRLVRDLAGKLGKEVELVTEGKSTELDKGLTERIIDPLTHLVRNSLDHGIEMPECREAAGKLRSGRLTLSARHRGGSILIEVSDDGGGLDRDRILAKARSNGLPVSDEMADNDVWQLIFAPGFSTAEAVSDVSGRGVGMDVVKRNIQAMGGQVEILSEPGRGTSTRVVLPLTLAILDGMSVRVGGETFVLPVSGVIESLQPVAEDLHPVAGGDLLLKVREDYLPLVAVHRAVDVRGATADPTAAIAVIVQGEGRRYALQVDELIGQQQVVVKNLESNYRMVPGVSAATILGDGSVALILDIAGLHRLNESKKDNPIFGSREPARLQQEAQPS